MSERQRRARAIWGYSGLRKAALEEKAGIKPGRVKAWTGERPANAEPEELRKLAAAVPGIPRQFVERGFEGLWDPDERLVQDVARLHEEIDQLKKQVKSVRAEAAKAVQEVGQRLDDGSAMATAAAAAVDAVVSRLEAAAESRRKKAHGQ